MDAITNAKTRAEADAAYKQYMHNLRAAKAAFRGVGVVWSFIILVAAFVCGFVLVGLIGRPPSACSVAINNSTAEYDSWKNTGNTWSLAYIFLCPASFIPFMIASLPIFSSDEDEAKNKWNEARRRIAEDELRRREANTVVV